MGLVALLVAPAGAFAALFEKRGLAPFDAEAFVAAWLQALGLGFANAFAFLGINRLYFLDVLKGLPPELKVVASVQTVLGFVLLFFLGLGLRNRFRLK